ncbi:hypothetical protein BJ742DRAFT_803344 [Cladochytrium replicatum]|nr:hypothetical protein BJ742DRAFT_803344 [Cladochytrium replicatum]
MMSRTTSKLVLFFLFASSATFAEPSLSGHCQIDSPLNISQACDPTPNLFDVSGYLGIVSGPQERHPRSLGRRDDSVSSTNSLCPELAPKVYLLERESAFRATVCQNNIASCVQGCSAYASTSGDGTQTNTCDSTTMEWKCVCNGGKQPTVNIHHFPVQYYQCEGERMACTASCVKTGATTQNIIDGTDWCNAKYSCGGASARESIILGKVINDDASGSSGASTGSSGSSANAASSGNTQISGSTSSSGGSASGGSASGGTSSNSGASAVNFITSGSQKDKTFWIGAVLLPVGVITTLFI